jgi:hypothetical protein
MTNNEEPRWSKIAISQTVDELAEYGPTIRVVVRNPETSMSLEVSAQIDTGASETAITSALAERLRLNACTVGGTQQAGSEARDTQYFGIKLFLLGTDIPDLDMEVAGLPGVAPPHDVLIGRDILQHSMMLVDFFTGETTIHLSAYWNGA